MKKFLNRAISDAVMAEMKADEKVILIGEDIKNLAGGLSIFMGVPDAFPDRCLEMPISESAYANFACGAAMLGYKPIVDVMFCDFSTITSDAIINNAAKYRFVTNGTKSMPIVFTLGNGSRGTFGAWSTGCNHSQCMENMFHNIPGLKILMPYYPADAYGLLRAAIQDDDPVLFYYHCGSVGVKAEVPDGEYVIPIEHAGKVVKEGKDVTIVAFQSMVPMALNAVKELEEAGIDAEIIDPRVLIPFDRETVYNSVKKTGKLMIVHEAPTRGGIGGEIAALVAEDCFDYLKAPIRRLGALNCPSPVGPMEQFLTPKPADIVRVAKELVKA